MIYHLDRPRPWITTIQNLWHLQFLRISTVDAKNSARKSYTKTLNLPKSTFPMKHGRKLELNVEKQNLKFENLFPSLEQEKRGTFILHDGPPYANGDPHFGHAINRVLKDILVKRKLLENYQVDFRPGWDCHGLPIELKALPENPQNVSALEIREKARQLATMAIERQREAFQKLFISADWSNSYKTFDVDYSIKELKAFYQMFKNDLIFRDRMPVYWSPSTGTALAEAELQYKPDHVSRAAYISFPIYQSDIEALIWTTTPWTLLANEAIAFSERLNYCLIQIPTSSKLLLVAKENVSILEEKITGIEIKEEFDVSRLHHCHYQDPISGEIRPFVPSIHVTSTKGTGLVHVAPNHGHDDYKLMKQHLGQQHSLNDSIVDDQGRLKLPDGQRLSIIEDNCASKYVLDSLWPTKSVILVEDYQHSYPYDWRSNKPILILPSDQWFLNIDSIRNQCIDALKQVKFYPELLRKEMINQLLTRPNWCLSRQRKYGVPIPVFYDKQSKQPVLNDQTFEAILNKFKSNGLDVWWQQEPVELLSECAEEIKAENLLKGQDILDIWFDSGCSWYAVLPEPQKISDVYLEGVDQLRGWFQSSLITSVALRNHAPYRSLLIHGFALDSHGHKMSKSVGNVIDPMDLVDGKFTKSTKNGDCGVDGLRFWIARYACTHNDVHVDVQEFNEDVLTIINRFRNTFRFLLGYISHHPPQSSEDRPGFLVQPEHYHDHMKLLDKYLLCRILKFHQTAKQYYDEYRFGELIESIIHHFNHEISTFYLTRIKDRLYCDPKESSNVRSILTVLYHCYHTLAYHMAPVLPHLIMECHQYSPTVQEGIIMDDLRPDDFIQKFLFSNQSSKALIASEVELYDTFRLITSIIDTLNQWTGAKHRLIDFDCHLSVEKSDKQEWIMKTLQIFQPSSQPQIQSDLVECLQVAQSSFGFDDWTSVQNEYTECLHILDESRNSNPESGESNHEDINKNCLIRINLRLTSNTQCLRCRRFNIRKSKNSETQLCDRCTMIVKN